MFFCYIDEAGCPGALPSSDSNVQPLLALSGLFLPQKEIQKVTSDFIALKSTFNPNIEKQFPEFFKRIQFEVKGADLRRDIREGNRNKRRYAIGFMSKLLDIIEKAQGKFVARLWIKMPGAIFNGVSVYTSSIQWISFCFQKYLAEVQAEGLIVADSRRPAQNVNVSHSIFTQKFKSSGDSYDRILEMPTFGHSQNHACLQISDLLCSAFLFPAASYVYCRGHIQNVHVSEEYALVLSQFKERLKNLQYRYCDAGRWKGGITVSDSISKRSSSEIFA